MVEIVLLISYFILCHTLVEKNRIPMWLQKLSIGKLMFVAIIMIGLSAMISVGVGSSIPIILMTIGFGSIISIQYRRKIGNLEKGKI